MITLGQLGKLVEAMNAADPPHHEEEYFNSIRYYESLCAISGLWTDRIKAFAKKIDEVEGCLITFSS